MRLEVVRTERSVIHYQEQIRGTEVNEIQASSVKTADRNHIMNGYRAVGWVVQRIYEDRVEILGREMPALCIEYYSHRQGLIRVWYSHEIPVYGMLKQVTVKPSGQEQTNAVLVDWSGRSE